jgi:RNA polymerase sigma factor (sigma-70 family)
LSETEEIVALGRDARYRRAAETYGPSIARLAAAYEANPAERADLTQEMHFQLWRSLAGFDGRCSLRTWAYRVAHNVGASHAGRAMRRGLVTLDVLASEAVADERPDPESATDRTLTLSRLYALIHRLAPLDRQLTLLYLDGLDAEAIGDVSGLTPGAVATRISRIKQVLAARFNARDRK